MKIGFFKEQSPFYDYRWFIVFLVFILGFMLYHDLTGGRMFSSSRQQQWSSSGPGYHK